MEIPEPLRRAMEAQARRTGKIDVAAIESAIQEDPIPADAALVEEQEMRFGRMEIDPGDEAAPEEVVEQAALWGSEPVAISYETLLSAADVATYKRVKAQTMRIAEDAREIAARMVGATIGDGSRSGKHFLRTQWGLYRLATSTQSDNSTEVAAHERMHVETIHLSEPQEIIDWFTLHGLDGRLSYDRLVRDLRARYQT